jgi:hypothetical protein
VYIYRDNSENNEGEDSFNSRPLYTDINSEVNVNTNPTDNKSTVYHGDNADDNDGGADEDDGSTDDYDSSADDGDGSADDGDGSADVDNSSADNCDSSADDDNDSADDIHDSEEDKLDDEDIETDIQLAVHKTQCNSPSGQPDANSMVFSCHDQPQDTVESSIEVQVDVPGTVSTPPATENLINDVAPTVPMTDDAGSSTANNDAPS